MQNEEAVEALNNRHSLPDGLHFEAGQGGLTSAVVDNSVSRARIYLHGAHVAEWQPAGHEPVLFMSSRSAFAPGKAIRGGVPICFPWFGPHPSDKAAPSHGLARTSPWSVERTSSNEQAVTIELAASFKPFDVRYVVVAGNELSMSLHIQNTSQTPARFEAALHTYLSVGEAAQIQITGLEHAEYLDKVDDAKRKNQGAEPIRFTGETDRVYINTDAACVLTDPVLKRKITVGKSGSRSTVVWNPWIDKAKALNDMEDDGWQRMACIETANAGPDAVTLNAGVSHVMNATLRVEAI